MTKDTSVLTQWQLKGFRMPILHRGCLHGKGLGWGFCGCQDQPSVCLLMQLKLLQGPRYLSGFTGPGVRGPQVELSPDMANFSSLQSIGSLRPTSPRSLERPLKVPLCVGLWRRRAHGKGLAKQRSWPTKTTLLLGTQADCMPHSHLQIDVVICVSSDGTWAEGMCSSTRPNPQKAPGNTPPFLAASISWTQMMMRRQGKVKPQTKGSWVPESHFKDCHLSRK